MRFLEGLKITHVQITDQVKKSKEILKSVTAVIHWCFKTDWTDHTKRIPDNLSAAWN
jgi:hypothetical protein